MADAATSSAVDVGTILAGTYKVTGLLGRGGMGAVWAAEHARLPGKRVAIKVLHAEIAGDEESLARFRREAEIASRLGHPNIVDVHDFNALPDGSPYLVLEYLEGTSLDDRIRSGPMPLEHVHKFVRQISSALAAAHAKQIIHRDLKPANIFLCPTERDGHVGESAKVLDFGISKIRGSQTVKTQDSTILGTPQYMAPEQATGNHSAVDARTDIFALGAIIYEMLTGQAAFAGQTIPEVVFKVVYEEPPNLGELAPNLPPNVIAAVHRALSKKQEERFSSVSELVEALTGSPLTTLRKGEALVVPQPKDHSAGAIATGATVMADTADTGKKLTGEAFAETMHSGKHAPVVPAPTGDPEPSSGKSKTLLLALGALVLVGGAIGGTIAFMGGSEKDTSSESAALDDTAKDNGDTNKPDPGNKADDGAKATDDDKAKKVDDDTTAKKADNDTTTKKADDTTAAKKADNDTKTKKADDTKKAKRTAKKTKRAATKPTHRAKPDPVPDSASAAKVRELIGQGEAALRGGNATRAIHFARRSFQVKPTSRGYYLLVRAYCSRSDLGNARANLHRVRGRLRVKAKAYCARNGVEL